MYERKGNLVEGVFKKYFLPTILMAMALSMGIIIDGIIVGNTIGSDALAAVNLVMPVTLCFNTIYALFGVGGAALASIAKGQRDNLRADAVFTISILSMLALSIILLVVGSVYLDEIARMLSGGGALQNLVRDFLRVLMYGAPLLIVTPGFVYFVRTDGKPNLASAVLIVANVVNLCLDLVYILVFDMGIAGAALATVTGYAVGFFMLFKYIFSKDRNLHFSIKKGTAKIAGQIAASGIPSAIGTFLLFVRISFVNSIVLQTIGQTGMVAFSVCLSCLSFVSMFIAGASQTMMPIVGTLYGEKDTSGIRFTAYKALRVVMIACLVLVALFEAFPQEILFLFGVTGTEEIALGVQAIRVFALSLIGTGFSFLMMYYFQTIQRRALSSAVSIVQGVAVVVPCAYILSGAWGSLGIWISFLLAEIGTFILIRVATAVISGRSGGRLKGFFLVDAQKEQPPVLDVTIANEKSQATGISEKVIRFCREHGAGERTASHVGLAVEEMAVNTIEHGYKKGRKSSIDIRLRISNEDIIIAIRDDGVPFDPTSYRPEEKEKYSVSGIGLVRAIAKSMDYSRLLGMNSTIIKISLPEAGR